ncbi:2Fe-2S iron-sulfur cluster-binding protein [Bdellovibrio bacteriovorus]|uniref:2Fe-2S iron-sulfur cluster-binding protein n=2 Tax=Bdellovibrio bacteriovorus TaxID=959 RepID=UPI0035A7229A
MPLISFKKNRPAFEVPSGANLMKSLLEAGLPVASSCDGDGVCAKCKIIIVEGKENLTPENETEAFLRESKDLPKDVRISCQTHVIGDVTIDATYW